jgi:hypothetical protein
VEVGRIVEVMATRRFEGGGNNEGAEKIVLEESSGAVHLKQGGGTSYTGSWNVTKFGALW